MSGWTFAGLAVLLAGAVVLWLWVNLRTALNDLAVLEQKLMEEARRAAMWQWRFDQADEEIGRLQAEIAGMQPAFTADDMAFLLREASRLEVPKV